MHTYVNTTRGCTACGVDTAYWYCERCDPKRRPRMGADPDAHRAQAVPRVATYHAHKPVVEPEDLPPPVRRLAALAETEPRWPMTVKELGRLWRQVARRIHPDVGGDQERFKAAQVDYEAAQALVKAANA